MQQCDIGCFPGFLIFQLVNTYHTKEIWVSMVSNRNRVLLFCIVALNLFVECFHFHFIKMNHLLIVSLIFCLHSVYCLILLANTDPPIFFDPFIYFPCWTHHLFILTVVLWQLGRMHMSGFMLIMTRWLVDWLMTYQKLIQLLIWLISLSTLAWSLYFH